MNITARQRLLAIFVAALLAISLVPTWAFANDDSQGQQENPAEQVVAGEGGSAEAAAGENNGSVGEAAGKDGGSVGVASDSAAGEPENGGGQAGAEREGEASDDAEAASKGASAPEANKLGAAAQSGLSDVAAVDGAAAVSEGLSVDENQISVSVSIFGPDENGTQSYWLAETSYSAEKGAKASSVLEQALKAAGLQATIFGEGDDWYLSSIKAPYDPTADLGWDGSRFWQFFVNGVSASVGAGQYALVDGDAVSLVYSAYGDAAPGWVSSTCEVIGLDSNGDKQVWARGAFTLKDGATAADLSEALFDAKGLTAVYGDGTWGWHLSSIASPFDSSCVLSWDSSTGAYWQFFVNGEPAQVGAGGHVLKAGDSIAWVYGSDGAMPDASQEIVIDSSASRPDWEADWVGSASCPVDAPTPVDYLKDAWTFDYSAYLSSTFANASEPVIVNGFVYLAVDNRLLKIDAETSQVLKSAYLKASVGYTSRPVYAQGVVIVPLDGGAVQALTADELVTVWVTDAVSSMAQSNSALTVDGDYVYVGTVDVAYAPDWTALFNEGRFMKIDIVTGEVKWTYANPDEGYYWGGAAVARDYVVVATSAGTVEVLNRDTGKRVSSLSLRALANSSCVASADGSTVYVVTRDGRLHVLSLGADGALGEKKSLSLGLAGSACMPTVGDGLLFVGGETEAGSALAIVDLKTFDFQLVSTADGAALPSGGIKGAPLVSAQAGGTYVYFTVNYGESADWVTYTSGGGVYRYKLGAEQAELVYGAEGHHGFCDSPVACDKDGNLYYINDSYTLFKLTGGGLKPGQEPGEDDGGEGGAGGGAGGGVGNGDGVGGGLQGGTGGVLGGTVAPVAVPVAGDGDGDAAGVDGNETDAAAKAEGDVALLSSESVATGARGVADGSAADEMASPAVWPYVMLGVGIVAALGAIGWFVAARRRGGVR